MIFVTGGTGLLGNSIVRELCQRGEAVRALCRQGTDQTPFEGLDVEIVSGDLSDKGLLADAVAGCRAVIHSAALIHIGWDKLELSREVNVEGTRRLIHACATHDVRLIHISTVDTLPAAIDKENPIDESGNGGVPKTPCSYVLSKTEAEDCVREAIAEQDLDAVIIHPGFMLGPHDWKPSSGRMMLEVNKAPLVAAPIGGCSLCDARDVAAGIANAVEKGERGANYILAGENLTYREMWRMMLETTGRKRRVHSLGRGIKVIGKLIDLFNRLTPAREGDVNGAAIEMGCLNHFYDSRLAEAQLDYRRRPIKETLVEAWAWLNR